MTPTARHIGTILDYCAALEIDRTALSCVPAEDLQWIAETLIADEHRQDAAATQRHRQILSILGETL